MKRSTTLPTDQLGSNSHALTKHIYHSKHQIWFLSGERLRVMGKDSKREESGEVGQRDEVIRRGGLRERL